MKRASFQSARILGCLFGVALCALPQSSYTISAKPGAVNYVEGDVALDGQALGSYSLKSTFMNAGSLLETQAGKAEVLLTPGVFLRIGDHSRVRMLKPSLADTQLEVEAGESIVEVDEWVKESRVTVSMHGGLTDIQKTGLYRFMADGEPSVATLEGRAEVTLGEKHVSLSKGHEVVLTENLKTREFDKNRDDDLFAWSNIRSQYNASMTYQAAKTAYTSDPYGYSNSYYGNGWNWNTGFNSWLWMPYGYGSFFSPFGYGFYGPGVVMYAPVVYVPVLTAGGTGKPILPTQPTLPRSKAGTAVPVNPRNVPAVGVYSKSPASLEAARMVTARTISANGGLHTMSGAPVSRSGFVGNGGSGTHGYAGGTSGGGSHSAAMSSSGSFGGASAHASGGGGGHK